MIFNRQTLKLVVLAASLGVISGQSFAAGIEWSDTYLNIRNYWGNTEPGFEGTVPELAGNISYANGWTYGSNFVSLDFENIGKPDGAVCCQGAPGGKGTSASFESYNVFRTTLSGNKISGTKNFAFGPVSDVGLELGGDVATQDDQLGIYKRYIIVGPQFSFALPKGFWTATIAVAHEWTTNSFQANNSVSFNTTYAIESAWLYPFNIGPVPLRFEGFLDFIGPKGTGGSGGFYHNAEFLLHPKLMVDVGDLIGYAPNKFVAGVGYEYWMNKFGTTPHGLANQGTPGGSQQNAIFIEAGYHF